MIKIKLLNKDFLSLILAQILSKISDRVLIIAISWHIIKTFDSQALATFFTITMLPYFLIVLSSGYLINKFTAIRIIKYSEFSKAIIYIILGCIFLLMKNTNIELLTIFILLSNIATSIFNPALMMVPNEIFPDTKSLQSSLGYLNSCESFSRLIGPIFAIPLYEVFTIGGLVLVCGFLYLLAWIGEIKLTIKNQEIANQDRGSIKWFRSPLEICRKYKVIMVLLIIFLFTNIFVIPIQIFLPILSKNVYHGDVALLSFFEIVLASGMLLGGMFAPTISFIKKPWKKISIPYFLFGLSYIGLSLAHNSVFASTGLFILGFFLAIGNVTTITFFQTHSAMHDNADIMAYVSFISTASAPISMSLAGMFLNSLDTHNLIFIYAVGSLICTSLILFYKPYRELKS